jgi:hypothetical protein
VKLAGAPAFEATRPTFAQESSLPPLTLTLSAVGRGVGLGLGFGVGLGVGLTVEGTVPGAVAGACVVAAWLVGCAAGRWDDRAEGCGEVLGADAAFWAAAG